MLCWGGICWICTIVVPLEAILGFKQLTTCWNNSSTAKAWSRMCMHIYDLVTLCQMCKNETMASAGLLQPLPIPDRVWQHISMDFIEGLPPWHRKSVIFVVVNRLSKYVHFLSLKHPYTSLDVAQLFMNGVFWLHGLPFDSDRDVNFLSKFWQEFFKLQQVNLHMSPTYHPYSDGQTEVVNRCLEFYLRCMVANRPKEWRK